MHYATDTTNEPMQRLKLQSCARHSKSCTHLHHITPISTERRWIYFHKTRVISTKSNHIYAVLRSISTKFRTRGQIDRKSEPIYQNFASPFLTLFHDFCTCATNRETLGLSGLAECCKNCGFCVHLEPIQNV